ncbi:N-acetylglucosamine-6-phosphate deacetylase [Vibrio sinaloensis]|uniref:N-acetylglucosamine-6-phosphate deacetylase n=1 Tax=Photobacterium sp. (strain ATCC 43367) TaxID=379097 RepID=UPI0035EE4909
MTLHAISAPRLFDGVRYHNNAALVWQGSQIKQVLPFEQLPESIPCQHYTDSIICPGFIDIQVNGGGGIMLNSDTSPAAMQTICEAHRQFGTAYLLPTLISATPSQLAKALQATKQALNDNIAGVLGVHLEGPWLNPKKKGAHDASLFYAPEIESLEGLPWLKQGKVLVTCAAELIDTNVLRWLDQQGVILSCGHSNAQFDQLTEQKMASVSGFTHLYNAMSPFEGRSPGTVGRALLTDHAWCSVITDGIHVHPQSVLLAHRIKPEGKLLIVTDAMASVGSVDNKFELDGQTIELIDGKLVNNEGSLAGAHIGMDESVANVIRWGIEESEAIKMASTYPAQAMRCDDLGQLAPGYRAAATVLSNAYQSQAVLVDGIVY